MIGWEDPLDFVTLTQLLMKGTLDTVPFNTMITLFIALCMLSLPTGNSQTDHFASSRHKQAPSAQEL